MRILLVAFPISARAQVWPPSTVWKAPGAAPTPADVLVEEGRPRTRAPPRRRRAGAPPNWSTAFDRSTGARIIRVLSTNVGRLQGPSRFALPSRPAFESAPRHSGAGSLDPTSRSPRLPSSSSPRASGRCPSPPGGRGGCAGDRAHRLASLRLRRGGRKRRPWNDRARRRKGPSCRARLRERFSEGDGVSFETRAIHRGPERRGHAVDGPRRSPDPGAGCASATRCPTRRTAPSSTWEAVRDRIPHACVRVAHADPRPRLRRPGRRRLRRTRRFRQRSSDRQRFRVWQRFGVRRGPRGSGSGHRGPSGAAAACAAPLGTTTPPSSYGEEKSLLR